jgi:Protein of unknown function (DUF667)
VRNGHVKRLSDGEIGSLCLELAGTNVATTYISCPPIPEGKTSSTQGLGIKLPFLILIIKNLGRQFSFEVTILDDKGIHRRFRASTYQTTTRVKPFITTMPMKLDEGWNQIQFNLSDFTRRAYATNYVETVRVQIHANCRIRRIYFADKLYSEHDLPKEYMLFVPPKAPAVADAAAASSASSAAASAAAAGGALSASLASADAAHDVVEAKDAHDDHDDLGGTAGDIDAAGDAGHDDAPPADDEE